MKKNVEQSPNFGIVLISLNTQHTTLRRVLSQTFGCPPLGRYPWTVLDGFHGQIHSDVGVVLEDEARGWTVPVGWKGLGETPGAAAGPAPTVPMRLANDTVEVGLRTKQYAGVIAG
jgi:hypothetical protein